MPRPPVILWKSNKSDCCTRDLILGSVDHSTTPLIDPSWTIMMNQLWPDDSLVWPWPKPRPPVKLCKLCKSNKSAAWTLIYFTTIVSWWWVFVVAGAMKSEGDVQVSLVWCNGWGMMVSQCCVLCTLVRPACSRSAGEPVASVNALVVAEHADVRVTQVATSDYEVFRMLGRVTWRIMVKFWEISVPQETWKFAYPKGRTHARFWLNLKRLRGVCKLGVRTGLVLGCDRGWTVGTQPVRSVSEFVLAPFHATERGCSGEAGEAGVLVYRH